MMILHPANFFISDRRSFLGQDTPKSVPSVSKMPERGYSVTGLDPDRTVKCAGRELRISPKASVELCRTIRGMKHPEAKKLLERGIEKKVAVAYRHYHKEVPHRRQLTEPWFAGRFPQKAAGRLLRLLEELEANAEYRNLDTERLKIIHAAAQRANKIPRRNPFFFQAEDGIRAPLVTGVQTCALPI